MKLFFLLIILVIQLANAADLDDFLLMSEDFPPYNYKNKEKISGSSVETFDLLLKSINSKKKISDVTFYPWARSYSIIQEQPSSMLFVMTKTSARQNLFKWVGPISKAENVVIGKLGFTINDKSLSELESYNYCVVKNDAAGQILKEKYHLSESKITEVSEPNICIQMLKSDRIKLFAYDLHVANWLLTEANEKKENYETKFVLSEGEHYFAFNKSTPDELINKLQKHLIQIKKSKEFELIKRKYFGN